MKKPKPWGKKVLAYDLARSTFDLFAIVKQIADAGACCGSLAKPWANTGTSTGRFMLAVQGGLADVERDLIRTRTAEGRSRAKVRGQHMGRPLALMPQQRRAEGPRSKSRRAAMMSARRRFRGLVSCRQVVMTACPHGHLVRQ